MAIGVPQTSQPAGLQQQNSRVGRSAPKPFDAMGDNFDDETAQKFKTSGPAIPLTAAQKLDFNLDATAKVSLVLMGSRSKGFQSMVDDAAKKGFKFVVKEVPFGNFKKVKRIFAVKPREKEEGGMRA